MFEVCSCFQSSKQTHRHTSAHHVCLFVCLFVCLPDFCVEKIEPCRTSWREMHRSLGQKQIFFWNLIRTPPPQKCRGSFFLQGGKTRKSYCNHIIVYPVKTSWSINVEEMPASLAGQIPPFFWDRNSKTHPHTPWIKKDFKYFMRMVFGVSFFWVQLYTFRRCLEDSWMSRDV